MTSSDPARVRSESRKELLLHWFAALVFVVLGGSLFWGILPRLPDHQWWWRWVGLAGGVGAGLFLIQTVVMTLRQLRYGTLELELDPVPGSLGGHVGGSLVVPVRARAEDFRVVLSCVKSEIRGSGKNRSRWESPAWTREMIPEVEPAGGGVRVRFTFPVPAEMPPTEEESDSYHYWAVAVTADVPGLDLDRVWRVPVRKTREPLEARRPALPEELGVPDTRQLPPSVVTLESLADGVRLRYPMGRNAAAGVGLTVAGAFFSGLPLGFVIMALGGVSGLPEDGVELAIAAVALLILSGFVLVGLVLILLGVYSLVNTLEVTLTENEIRGTRRVLGVPFSRAASVDEVESVEASIQGHVGQGARAKVFYDIRAFLEGGGRIVLGDDVPRPELAQRLCRLITAETGLPAKIVPRRSGVSSKGVQRDGSSTHGG